MRQFSLRVLLLAIALVGCFCGVVARRHHLGRAESNAILVVNRWPMTNLQNRAATRDPFPLQDAAGRKNFVGWTSIDRSGHFPLRYPRMFDSSMPAEPTATPFTWNDLFNRHHPVRCVHVPAANIAASELVVLQDFFGLQFVLIEEGTPQHVQKVLDHPTLTLLQCFKSQITDEECVGIGVSKQLVGISIFHAPEVSDQGAVALAQNRRFQAVALIDCPQVGDAGASALLELPDLISLRLTHGSYDDAAVLGRRLGSRLRELWLSECDVSDLGAEHLAQFHALEELRLRGTRISDRGVQALARLPNLQYLHLERTEVTDEAFLSALEDPSFFPALRYVDLRGTWATPELGQKLRSVRKIAVTVDYDNGEEDYHERVREAYRYRRGE